jgi:lysophospholipase
LFGENTGQIFFYMIQSCQNSTKESKRFMIRYILFVMLLVFGAQANQTIKRPDVPYNSWAHKSGYLPVKNGDIAYIHQEPGKMMSKTQPLKGETCFKTPDLRPEQETNYALSQSFTFPETIGKATNNMAIVVLPGRSELLEHHYTTINFFHEMGFSVLGLDWRGQGLSSRQLKPVSKGHIDSYRTYLDDLSTFIDHFKPQFDGMIFFSHSMGSHVGLHYLAENPDQSYVKGVMTESPMLDVVLPKIAYWPARLLTKAMHYMGLGEKNLPIPSGHGGRKPFYAKNIITTDPYQWDQRAQVYLDYPYSVLKKHTFDWLYRSFEAMDWLRTHGPSRVNQPVLILMGEKDTLVSNKASTEFAKSMKKSLCTLEIITDSKHGISREIPSVRRCFYASLVSWLRTQKFIA